MTTVSSLPSLSNTTGETVAGIPNTTPSPNKLITDIMCTSMLSGSAITHSLLTLIQNLPHSAI